MPRRHDVRVLDLRVARFAGRHFLSTLERFRPDLVGLSGYSHEATVVRSLARLVRATLPATRIVVGGHHATVAPVDFNETCFDAVVRGEGCAPFAAVVAAVERGDRIAGIPGVLQPGEDWDEAEASCWPHFPDPATLPLPRRDLWDPGRYRAVWVSEAPRPWQTILPAVSMVRTSFGCRMRCSFCIVPQLYAGRHLPRPVEAVAEEIAATPSAHVYFCDDENFIDEEFAAALAEALAGRGVRKRYFAWTRSTTVNRSPELFRRWRELGLDAAFLGFEFPTDEELQDAHKGASVAANERALTTLRSLGIAVHAAFMVRPEYTREQFARLRSYVAAMPPAQCSFTVYTPSPGTPDYEAMRERIWVKNAHDLHDCMHPLTPTALPLPEFARLLGAQAGAGIAKTPLRSQRNPLPPADLVRILAADARYRRAFATIHRDYPRELRGDPPHAPV